MFFPLLLVKVGGGFYLYFQHKEYLFALIQFKAYFIYKYSYKN